MALTKMQRDSLLEVSFALAKLLDQKRDGENSEEWAERIMPLTDHIYILGEMAVAKTDRISWHLRQIDEALNSPARKNGR